MGFLKSLGKVFRSALGGEPTAQPSGLHQFCTDAEAEQAKAEINRLVDGFVQRQAGRARTNMDVLRPLTLGYRSLTGRFGLRAAGRGWYYESRGFCGLLVTETGHWSFQGYYIYRHGAGLNLRDLSGWSFSRDGGWPQIPPFELTNVAEVASASPVVALTYFQRAIAQWESEVARG